MRKSFRPAWYLPSGAINAADGQLEAASSACERWGLGGAGAVVIAVIAELIIAWIEPPYSTFLADSAIADGIIAIGITVEVVLGTMWNNHIQTELRKRSNKRVEAAEIALGDATRDAGEAKERAAALELELFKLRSPRQLDEKAFKAALEGRPKWPVTEVLYVDASDCVQVAAQIIVALGDAGWDVNGVPTPIRGPNPGCEFPVHLIRKLCRMEGKQRVSAW